LAADNGHSDVVKLLERALEKKETRRNTRNAKDDHQL
jgi:hypothetical protein